MKSNSMNKAEKIIRSIYDYEICKEISEHSYKSVDVFELKDVDLRITFYEENEDDIIRFIRETLDPAGSATLLDIFRNSDYSLKDYMNDVTCAFIELVAMKVVDEHDSSEED